MKKNIASVLVTLMLSFGVSSAENMEKLFKPFAQILERHLIEKDLEGNGLVSAFNYREALKDNDVDELRKKQVERLKGFDIGNLKTREVANAFWINAYNFFMIEYILANPKDGELISSVRDYGSFFNPYRVFRQDHFNIGGEKYSLDEMEKGILLGDAYKKRGWKEARVHFAVNCASVGCPALRKQIYTEENLDHMLTQNTQRAFKTPRHLHRDGRTLYLSNLFRWYAKDYIEEEGSIEEFILKYADEDVTTKVKKTSRIRYIDYDWSLNEPDNFRELKN